MDFLKEFKKDMEKAGLDEGSSGPPTYYYSSGNYVLDKLMSGRFDKGIAAQGRVTGLAGPSGAGKSFIACNIMRESQKKGAFLLVIDSENALDDEFVTKIGVDVNDGYLYYDPVTVPQVIKIVSNFITKYKKSGAEDEVLITIDSLDMLLTETEAGHFAAGESKGDQGQRNKQLKAMLRTFVQSIKRSNISIVVTSQVYKNQDLKNGEGVWIVSDAVKYSLSQICLLQKLKLKDKTTNKAEGIRMKVEGYKTRFTQPFQTAEIEVPYETGMDPYNGLVEVAKNLGVLRNAGAWYYLLEGTDSEIKWKGKNMPEEHKPLLLQACSALVTNTFLDAGIDDEELENVVREKSVKQQRRDKIDAVVSGEVDGHA